MIQINEIVAIGYFDAAARQFICFKLNRLIHFFHFMHMRIDGSVGSNKAIGTKVGIIFSKLITKISAVGPIICSIFSCLQNNLIYPIPNKSTLECIIFLKGIPIILQIADTIAHGMCVFTKDKWFFSFFRSVIRNEFYVLVHGKNHIGVIFIPCWLISYGTCIIPGFYPII